MDQKIQNRMQHSAKEKLPNSTFPIIYVPPLQPGNLNSSIERFHKCVNSTLQYTHIHTLRRCHELTHHYIMGRVEKQVSFDYSPKLGHRLTLILREVSETDSSDATIQVQLFDSYAALADCIKPGNLIILTGIRVDISMLCRANQRIPHSQLHITAKPQFQRNFKLFFMPNYTDVSLPVEETKFKVTNISASKSMKAAKEQMHVNVLGIITASTPFENVIDKEWRCFITLADHTVNFEYLNKCCLLNSSLLIKVVSPTCLHTFERGHILRIARLQIIEQNDVVLGLMQMECQSVQFQVSPDDTISVLPLHYETRIQPNEWQKVKEICCWWATVGKQDMNPDSLPCYLLSKGFIAERLNVLAKAVSMQVEDAKGHSELVLSQFPNPRKRKNPEICDGEEKTGGGVMAKTITNSLLKTTNTVMSSHAVGNNYEMRSKSTNLPLTRVENDGMKPSHTAVNKNVTPPVFLEGTPKHDHKNIGKLAKFDKLDQDIYFDIDCQVVGYYCTESFDKIVLKVWDGSKCPYIKMRSFIDATLTAKFEDPNLGDIDNYCVNVDVFGLYKQHAEIIRLFQIVKLCNVHASAGMLSIPGWYYKHRGITVYHANTFTENLQYELNMLREKLKNKDVNTSFRNHRMTSNPQPVAIMPPTTGQCRANILSVCDAFAQLEKIKQGFMTKDAAAISSNESQYNNVSAMTESLNHLPDVVKGAVEHTVDLFDPSAFKTQNKHLHSSLSMIGQEDMFFDIFSQVVGCYHNAEPLKIILKIWDGTKCQNAKCIKHYDSWTPVFEDPRLDDIDEFCICVHVYDEYMKMTHVLELYDIVKLCNLRARNGVFSMHGGQIRQRNILTCSPNSAVAKSLSANLNELRKNLNKNEKVTVDIKSPKVVIPPMPVQMSVIDDLDNEKSYQVPVGKDEHGSLMYVTESSVKEVPLEPNQKVQVLNRACSTSATDRFPGIVCAEPTKDCKARSSLVARIKKTPIPGKFCIYGAVFDIHPRACQVSDLVKWFCTSCQYMVSSGDLKDLKALEHFGYQCPCNDRQIETIQHVTTNAVKVLQPIFILYLTICDRHYQNLQVMLCGQQAETFFRNYSPVDFLKHEDVREQFATLFRSLCKAPGCLTKSSSVLHCHLCSSKEKNGNFIYNIVDTQLLPFHEITG